MDLFIKILGIAFIGTTSYLLLRSTQPQISGLIVVAAGVLILLLLSDPILNVIQTLGMLGENSGLTKTVFSSLLKIVGIGYLTEYSVSLCDDCGCSSLGKKIELGGKIVILLSALPIITQIVDLIGGLM